MFERAVKSEEIMNDKSSESTDGRRCDGHRKR